MGKMKKILAAGVVCYVAYKLGQKYLKENNLTAEDVFDSAKKKAEAFAKQAAGVVPTTKDGEPEGKKIYTFGKEKRIEMVHLADGVGKKIYTFGKEKRIEMVHLADGVTGLYDNKKNYPIEKQVKIYSEDGGKLYVYSDAADYVISDEPFFMNVYVKDKDKTEAIAIALGKQYDAEEIAVYNYGSSQKFDAQGMAAEAEAEKVAAEQAEAKAKEAELAAQAAAAKAEAAAKEAAENVEAAADKAEEVVEEAAENVKAKAEDIAGKAEEAAKEVVETVETTAEEVAEKAKE